MKRVLLAILVVSACGEVKDKRVLPDAAGFAATEISTETLAFEDGECGGQAAARSISFANTGDGALEWSASIEGAGFAIAGDASGTIDAGETAMLSVEPNTIATSARVGDMIEASLVVQTNARAEAFVVPLSMQVHGGSLLVETPLVAFGQIQVSVPAGATPLVIRNQGDRAIQVALGATTSAEFSATWAGAPSAQTIAPGATLDGATSGFVPNGDGMRSDSVAIVATGPLCAGDVANVSLAGEGTFAQIGVTPGAIAYGTTPCGSTATTRNVTIANNYNVAITYSAMVMSGPYAIAAGDQTGSIAANASVVIAVTANMVARAPASLGANVLDGSVRVTTSAPGHSPATIALDQGASGAVLALDPAPGSTVAFGNVVAGTPESSSYSITNTGNLAATVSVATTGSGFSASVPNGGSVPANGNAQTGSIVQTVVARGMHAGTFTLSTPTNRCQTAAAGALSLTANAQAPVASVGRVDTMSLQCGGGVSGTVSIPVRNTGDVPLTLTSPDVSSGFTLQTIFPVVIAPGDTVNLAARATAAVIGTDRGGTQRRGTLTFRTNEIGTPEVSIDLVADINGANIEFESPINTSVTSVMFMTNGGACPAPRPFGIRNSGNQPVSEVLFLGNTAHFRLSPTPAPVIAAGAVATTNLVVQVLDQQCSIPAPEQLRFRVMGSNICTTRNAASEVTLPARYLINGATICNCNSL